MSQVAVLEPSYTPDGEVGFRFTGLLADRSQLNFYESGRYRYGAARLLYTVGHFRNTGIVLDKITRQVNVDLRVSAPEKGSFYDPIEFYNNIVPFLGDAHVPAILSQIPFDKVLAWAIGKIIKPSNDKKLLEIIDQQNNLLSKQIDLSLSREASAVERERTAQIQAVQDTERLRILQGIIKEKSSELSESPEIVKEVSEIAQRNSSLQTPTKEPDADTAFITAELSAEVNRSSFTEEYTELFDQIPDEQEQKLTERIRKMFPDLGRPLKRSAAQMSIEIGSGRTSIAHLNERRISQIVEVTRSDESISLYGTFIRLDKDFGFGRFRPHGSKTSLPFNIQIDNFRRNRQSYINAYSSPEIVVEAFPFYDGIGNIVKLMIFNVV